MADILGLLRACGLAWGVLFSRLMTPEELRRRTMAFALAVAQASKRLPDDGIHRHGVAQLIRCSSAMGANYRAAGQARSRTEFVAKIGVVVEEADEAVFWLEYLTGLGASLSEPLEPLLNEARQLARIFVTSRQTARRNLTQDRKVHTITRSRDATGDRR